MKVFRLGDCLAGPDHGISMDPVPWRAMVDDTRLLEAFEGDGRKNAEANERETVALQRRCLRAAGDLPAGTVPTLDHLLVNRLAPPEAYPAHLLSDVPGSRVKMDVPAGAAGGLEDMER